MVFILGKTIDEAERFMEVNNFCRRHVRHVFGPLSLKGRPMGIMYIAIDGWGEREDSSEIKELLNDLKAIELGIKNELFC